MKLPIICERLGDDVLRLGVGAVDFTQPSYGFLPQEAAELAPGARFAEPLALRSAGETDAMDAWLAQLA